jgi:hypothetical protein
VVSKWITWITLSDGQSCQAGSKYDCNRCHCFDPAKKITKIETIIFKNEWYVCQINFFHDQERLLGVGASDCSLKSHYGGGGRREVFGIADDEQLIGCEL